MSGTVTVSPTQVILCPWSDTSSQVIAYSAEGPSDDQQMQVDWQVTADGGTRSVTKPGVTVPITKTLRRVSATDLFTLRSWTGTLVLIRDRHGLRVWGKYIASPARPSKDGYYDVDIVLTAQTVDESV